MTIIVSIRRRVKPAAGKAGEKLNQQIDCYAFSMGSDPEVLAEAGVPGFAAEAWYGMLVPAGTPKEIIQRLHADSVKALQFPDVKKRLDATGLVPVGNVPDEFGRYIRSEVEKSG